MLIGGARAGMRDRHHPRPVIGARPWNSCKAIHVAEFGVVRFISWGSERDDSVAWSYLAGSGVEPLPAITARPRSGQDPTRAPDSGDVTSLWVIAPAPHHQIYTRSGRRAAEKESSSFLLVVSGVLFLFVIPGVS